MANVTYITTPARFLHYILTADDTYLDQIDRETCDRWFSPAVLGVILDVEPGPPLTRMDEQYVCLVCIGDH